MIKFIDECLKELENHFKKKESKNSTAKFH